MKAFRIVTMGVCLAACLYCACSSLKDWAGENGRRALLFAAGLEAEAPSPGPTASPKEPAAAPASGWEGLWEESGVVPFHQVELPVISATPEPGRAWGPVEEILAEGGSRVEDFFVKDSTGAGLDLAEELKKPSPVALQCDGSVEVLIYHTHTSEAYAETARSFYYTDMETRTADRSRNVVAVGEALKKALEAEGIGVVHDTTVNDTIYNGSYSRSWEVIQKNLARYPGIRVTIDLHRDSMTTPEGVKYKPTVEINGRKAAQIMLLAGCNADDSWEDFPDWEQNLRLILRVQQKAQQLCPGLARPLNFSNSKYNMNATPGSMLIEVGTEVNTAAEARYSGRLLGKILAQVLRETKDEAA